MDAVQQPQIEILSQVWSLAVYILLFTFLAKNRSLLAPISKPMQAQRQLKVFNKAICGKLFIARCYFVLRLYILFKKNHRKILHLGSYLFFVVMCTLRSTSSITTPADSFIRAASKLIHQKDSDSNKRAEPNRNNSF